MFVRLCSSFRGAGVLTPYHPNADGWGDFADPAALYLDVGGTRPIELGGGGKETLSCDDLADRINAAIERVSIPDA